jgi:hypothetical protein
MLGVCAERRPRHSAACEAVIRKPGWRQERLDPIDWATYEP